MGFTKFPHWPIQEQPTHITYRLAGSVAKTELKLIGDRRKIRLAELEDKLVDVPDNLRRVVFRKEIIKINGRYEKSLDTVLHQKQLVPYHLNQPKICSLITESWKELAERKKIHVIAVCVMGNHVHVIVRAPDGIKEVQPGPLMQSHKRYTAAVANQILGATGQPFWASGYFDREIRKGRFLAALWYVLNNPKEAGLVENWQQWSGTYVHPDYLGLVVD